MEKWLTQALDGVIFFAVALFDLSTSSGLVVTLVVLDALLALAGSMFGLLLSRNLREGLLQKPIQILALSPLLIAASEALDLSEYITESTIIVLSEFLELLFLLALFLGFFMIYRTVQSIGEAGQVQV